MAEPVLKMKTDVENPETGLEHRLREATIAAEELHDAVPPAC